MESVVAVLSLVTNNFHKKLTFLVFHGDRPNENTDSDQTVHKSFYISEHSVFQRKKAPGLLQAAIYISDNTVFRIGDIR